MYRRNYNFDLIKGVLIILVIVGHMIPGTQRGTFPRYLIYSFHMPLFIGVSGFLLNFEAFRTSSAISLIKKYWKRLILPWIIAVNAYYFIWAMRGMSISLKGYIKAYLHPYYHLWYVLGFLAYLAITWILVKALNKLLTRSTIAFWFIILIFSLICSLFSKFITL